MKTYLRSLCVLTAVCVSLFGTSTPLFAGQAKSEDQLVQEMGDANVKVVIKAMMTIEKQYPHSVKALPLFKSALKDSRPEVRRKAARILGIWHEDLSADDIQNICVMLKATDRNEVMDALKSLGGVRAKSAIPEILPCLKNENAYIVRDACRALAEIGDKSVIPDIEPLTNSTDAKIKKDAQDAIFKLK